MIFGGQEVPGWRGFALPRLGSGTPRTSLVMFSVSEVLHSES